MPKIKSKSPVLKRKGNKYVITDEFYDAIENAYANGCQDLAELCKILGVNKNTFNGWYYDEVRDTEDDPVSKKIGNAVKRGIERQPTQLLKLADIGMRKLLAGYEFEEVTTEKIETPDQVTTKEKVIKKQISPNATMVMFTKVNLDPENWQSINKVENIQNVEQQTIKIGFDEDEK